jgi:hypothetical protein
MTATPPARMVAQQGPTVPRHVVEAVAATLGYDPADVLSIRIEPTEVHVVTVDRTTPRTDRVYISHRHGVA